MGAGSPLRADEPPDSIPAIFVATPLADAIAKSKQSSGVVIADFTAEWCAPCKMMERTVFRDPRVEKWVKDRGAVIIRIDTDQNAALRTEYAVSAWPTFIGFKNGEMIDRRLGGMTTDQFLLWLEKVDRAGKAAPGTETVVLPAPAKKPTGDGAPPPPEFMDQLEAARAARESGKFDKSLADLLRMWKGLAGVEPNRARFVRMSIAEEMKPLAERHAPAREAISAERDRLDAVLKTTEKTFEDLDGWLLLNTVLNDDARTLAWFDRIKGGTDVEPTLEKARVHLQPALERAERWNDIVRLTPDTMASLKFVFEMCRDMPLPERTDEQTRARLIAGHKDLFRYKAAGLYVGLLMLGRDDEAGRLATETIRLDDTPATRISLVEKATRLAQPRKAQLPLLDEAAKGGAEVGELRKRVAAAPK